VDDARRQREQQERRAFGRSLHADFYDVRDGVCDDLGFCYDLLDRLVTEELGVAKQAPPFIFRSPEAEFPDKAGISGWVPLIESGVSIHTLRAKRFVSLDVYTCGALDVARILEFLCAQLGTTRYEHHYLVRGVEYR
jgi:S-adenosylmethionine decarboxylase